jgi:acetylornithine deacetylase/succinyl-diaminopimelate desuccinylase-like protein
MDQSKVHDAVAEGWSASALPSLAAFVEIPALSPGFDASWPETGHLRAAVEHVRDWIASRDLPGARFEVLELEGRSPLLMVDVPATSGAAAQGAVILYGHLDKQPPVGGWSEGLGPWKAVIRDGRLYGRGAVDDGYSGYAATLALEAVNAAQGEHARAVLLLETGEESGSPDLPAYMAHLGDRLGEVSLVVCLDAGGGDYERLWLTNSLRGVVQATVTVSVLASAQHSGLASGIVPSSFRILRVLLERIEDAETGAIKLPAMNVRIPAERRAEAEALAKFDPGAPKRRHPLLDGVQPVSDDDVELFLNNAWRPTLSVIGASGLPEPADAGNVLRTSTSLKLSFRIPPTADPHAALAELEKALTTDVPYNAKVELGDLIAMDGWDAPALAPWLSETLNSVGDDVLGQRHQGIGIGGSVPFMTMLADRYPQAQFLVTGALGVDSNMHVPDEWLNLAFAQKVTEAIAHVLDAHARA